MGRSKLFTAIKKIIKMPINETFFIISGSLTAFFIIFILNAGFGVYSIYGISSDLISNMIQINTARSVQVALHEQILAWDKILIYGHSYSDFKKNYNEFSLKAEVIQNTLFNLKLQSFNEVDLVADIENLILIHKKITSEFTEYIVNLDQKNPSNPNKKIIQTQGKEAELIDSITNIAKKIETESENQSIRMSNRSIIFSSISSVFLITILIFYGRKIGSRLIKNHNVLEDMVKKITHQSKAQNLITEIIKEKTNILFQKIASQHMLLNNFNSNMKSQAARFSEMSATMEEISGASEHIATESAIQVNGNVKMEFIIDEFKDIRLETKRNLNETYNDIQLVSAQSSTANEHLIEVEKTVFEIKEQSNKIGQIVELIVDIADRINLLALNASIEAARAGETGRGFAVVADEIGKLAFQTQDSVKEINSVISSSSKSTVGGAAIIQKAVQMIHKMMSQMEQGANKIKMLQESLSIEDKFTQVIINQMKDNITQAEKIRTATDEQKIAVETSFKAIEELINILDGMVIEAKDMTKISDEIHCDATDIITETKLAASD